MLDERAVAIVVDDVASPLLLVVVVVVCSPAPMCFAPFAPWLNPIAAIIIVCSPDRTASATVPVLDSKAIACLAK